MNLPKDFVFFFLPGTCGSFAKVIFYYYLAPNWQQTIDLVSLINQEGHCHDHEAGIIHVHYIDELGPEQKIICVDFDKDDVPTIIRMAFAKFPKAKDPNFLVHKFGSMFRGVAAPSEILEVFLNRPYLLLDNRWDEWITQIKPAFTIKFKEILFGNLNKKISAYLGVKESQEIDDFILRYRIINKKYISY